MKKNFNIGENLGFGFDKTFKNILFFAIFFLVFFIITSFFSAIGKYELPGFLGMFMSFIISLSGFLASYIFFMLLLKTSLTLISNQKVNLKEVNKDLLPLLLKFILTTLLYWFIVLVGTVFLIIPGVILMIKYQFASLIILDEPEIGIREAFHKSNVLASGVQWKLFWFSIISDFLNFAGLIFLLIGFIFTGPTTIIAKTRIYKELKKQTK